MSSPLNSIKLTARDAELVALYAEDLLTEQQAVELNARLHADSTLLSAIAQFAEIEEQLRSLLDEEQATDDGDWFVVMSELAQAEARAEVQAVHLTDVKSEQIKPSVDRPSMKEVGQVLWYVGKQTKVWAPVAAVLVVVLTLALVFRGGNDGPAPLAEAEQPQPKETALQPAAVATLTAEHDAVWEEKPGGDHRPGALSRSTPRLGDQLAAGQRLTLIQGFAEIKTARGAVAILEAPATIELLNNDNALYLHTGKLVGICETESSEGFLVLTPHMDLTDLGTRFSVDASDPDRTDTHVLEGLVRVKPKGSKSPEYVSANQALSVNAAGDIASIQYSAVSFIALEPFGYAAVPSAYTDLRRDPAMILYYGFEAFDLNEGKVLNQAEVTADRMHGVLGDPDNKQSAPTLTEGRWPGTSALRFENKQFDMVRLSRKDAAAIDGLEQLTIALWIKPDDTAVSNHHLVTKRPPSRGKTNPEKDAINLAMIWQNKPGHSKKTNALLFTSKSTARLYDTGVTESNSLADDGRWRHIVVTFDRGVRRMYVNGKLIGVRPSQGFTRIPALDEPLFLGCTPTAADNANSYFDGDMDELFLLGRAMPAQEIRMLYESTAAQP